MSSSALTPKKGKSPGAKNFQSVEDINLTKAYRTISTDSSVGVDQDEETYYNRMAEEFAKLMGEASVQERSAAALKGRWLNVIQKALLKFTSCLNQSLSSYHSGWRMEDYLTQAKQFYQAEVNKPFSFDLCWKEVKHLPKFAICTDEMSNDMKRALGLDAEENGVGSSELSPKGNLAMARRPEIGKKKAKKLKFKDCSTSGSNRDAIYERMAQNSERRAQSHRDHFNLKLFMLQPDSESSQAFFALKKEEALMEARIQMLQKQKQLQELTAQLQVNAAVAAPGEPDVETAADLDNNHQI